MDPENGAFVSSIVAVKSMTQCSILRNGRQAKVKKSPILAAVAQFNSPFSHATRRGGILILVM